MRQPTIRDVAEKAGVSKSLVSLVMNKSPRVSDKSRKAVLTAASELGYRRNAAARSLVSQQSQLIGVVISSAYEIFHTEALDGVKQHVVSEDYTAFVQWGRRNQDMERKAIESFLEIRVDALILLGNDLAAKELETLAREVPIAIVGRPMKSSILDVVAGDLALGSTLAVEHLVELGHRHIAHIDGGSTAAGRARATGYRAAMKKHGLESRVVRGSFLAEGGAAGAERLIKSADSLPTAIVAPTDMAAMGAKNVLVRHGLTIPEDISWVGYDDTHLAAMMGIELTTIDQPAEEMGRQAAELVIARLKDPSRPAQNIVVEPSLVVRRSTGPPRAA